VPTVPIQESRSSIILNNPTDNFLDTSTSADLKELGEKPRTNSQALVASSPCSPQQEVQPRLFEWQRLCDFNVFEMSETFWVKPTTEDSNSPLVMGGPYHDRVVVSITDKLKVWIHARNYFALLALSPSSPRAASTGFRGGRRIVVLAFLLGHEGFPSAR
jgi:hypothetical protein